MWHPNDVLVFRLNRPSSRRLFNLSDPPPPFSGCPLCAPQDKKVKARIDARNQLETYCYNMKQVGSSV